MKKTVQAIFAGVFLLSVIFVSLPALGWPDHEVTKYIYSREKTIDVKDGMNASGKDLRNVSIHRRGEKLTNASFKLSNLSDANLQETIFYRCSFHKANLSNTNCYDSYFLECDFAEAIINGAKFLRFSKKELLVTASYQKKDLTDIQFGISSLASTDFSRCDLRNSGFRVTSLEGCRFDDARISGAHFYGGYWPSGGELMTKTQLASTWDFKCRQLINVTLSRFDLSGLDLSRFNLTGCTFYSANFDQVDFTNTVITGCAFHNSKNLTLDQIKSTWNYKMGNLNNFALPKNIREALDAEKKTKDPVEETN